MSKQASRKSKLKRLLLKEANFMPLSNKLNL
jgi:hypothetical protein